MAPDADDRQGTHRWTQRYTRASTGRCALLMLIFAALAVWRTVALDAGPERVAALLPALSLWLLLVVAGRRFERRLTGGSAVLAVLVFGGAVYVTWRMMWRQPDGVALLLTLVLWLATALAALNWLYRSHIRSLELTLSPLIGPGSDVTYRVVVTPKGRLSLHRGTLLLTAEERVHAPESDTSATEEVFRTEIEACRSLELAADRETILSGSFKLPEDVPPTVKVGRQAVSWTGRLWLGVIGWSPDAYFLLHPDPVVSPIGPPRPDDPAVPEPIEIRLNELDFCDGRLTLDAPLDGQRRACLHAGASTSGRLRMRQPTSRDPYHRVILEAGFVISGKGHEEAHTTQRVTLWEGDPRGERGIDVPVSVECPHGGPITYSGKLLRIEWSLTIRAESSTWTSSASVPIAVELGRLAMG